MGAIVLVLVLGGWLVLARACAESCDEGYCSTSLDVDPPEGFAFASDVYELRGDGPDLPTDGSVEIDIPVSSDLENGNGLSFYRYLPEASAWEMVTSASLTENGDRATGTFQELPATIVLMQRTTPAGHAVAFLSPGQSLHPQAQGQVTMVHTRDLTPGGDGSLNGEVSSVPGAPGQEHYVVITAGSEIDGSLANLDAILATSGTRTSHVSRIVAFAADENLDGVNLDYGELREDQRTSFALLVEELASELRNAGMGLAVTLPPPTRTPEAIDPGPYDWAVIGTAADLIVMEPIRDQSTYRRDLPEILRYLREQTDLSKVVLSVTPYAAERAEEVRRLTVVEAMQIATQMRISDTDPTTNENVELVGTNIDQTDGLSGVLWDESTATVAFTYRNGGSGRTVWIENRFSTSFKLEFVSAYGMGGFAVEDASDNEFLGNIWPALTSFVETGQPLLMRPNPEDLAPTWEVSGGTLESGQRGVARWTTPSEPGTYTVRLTLGDGVFRFQNEMDVMVEARGESEGSEAEEN